jgi:glycosyltransferase involved in cell wall biosynthesis
MTPLRVLVYPHAMEVGGSQLNAIELAAAVRERGHEVIVFGEDGPLVDVVDSVGLRRIPAPNVRRRPSPDTARRLRALVREHDLDIVHGYEWPPGVEAAVATYPYRRAAAVCTVMSMAVAPFLPAHMPLVVGTEALRRYTAARRSGPVYLIEPPVDVVANAPGHDTAAFRRDHGLDAPAPGRPPGDPVTLGAVCRLVPELKLEGLLTAIEVVGELAQHRPLRLVITGDGPAREIVAERAAKANASAAWPAVILVGELRDPRPAYAAADVMLGMGGSALRALCFGKPLIVQGERGFWRLLTPESCPLFLEQGWYGVGDGTGGRELLRTAIDAVVDDAGRRAQLGGFGRELAVERFSMQRAAAAQEEIYLTARTSLAEHGRGALGLAAVSAVGGVLRHKVRRKMQGLRGTRARDDFNVATLATLATNSSSTLDSAQGADRATHPVSE